MMHWLRKRIVLAAPTCTLWIPNDKEKRYEFIFNRKIHISYYEQSTLFLESF